MKKRMLLLIVFTILFFIPGFAQEESFSINFYPYNYMPCPDDKITGSLSLYYSGTDRQGNFSEEATVRIYEIPSDFDTSKYEEYISQYEPLKVVTKTVEMQNYGGNYWSGYTEVELPGLPSGNYCVVSSTDKCKYPSYFRVSNLGLSAKVREDCLLVFVQERKSGKSIRGADVSLHLSQETKKIKTDKNGIAKIYLQDIKGLEPGNYYRLVAVSDRDSGELNVTIPSVENIFKGYIYTDRPVYRPEQDVKFKGILRREKNNNLTFASDEKIGVVIKDQKGTEVYKDTLKTDEYGAISGSFTLEEEPLLGVYYIYCTDPDGQQATGSFKVEEYRKPEFEITVNPEKEQYIQGDNMTFNMEVNYYFGAPVPDTDFTYEIYREPYYPRYWYYWWEEGIMPYYYNNYSGEYIKSESGKTDKNGKASFSCEASKLDYDANYRVTVRMVDESRREVTGSAGILITKGAFYITVTPEKYYYEPGDKVNLKIEAKDYSDKPVKTDVTLKIKYERYDKEQNTWNWEEEKEISLKTDSKGLAYYDYKTGEDGYYEAVCEAQDQNENKINTTGYFYCYSGSGYYNWYNRFSNLEIIPDKNIYEPGETANIFIVCPFEGVKGLVTVEGESVFTEEVMDFSNRTGSMEIKLTPKHAPNFFVTVSFFYEGTLHYYTKKIICPSKDKFLTVSIEPDKEKYKPRDTAKFILKTLDPDNKPVTSQVTLGIADESVYAVAGESTPNIQKFFYGMKENMTTTYGSDGNVYGGMYYYGSMNGGLVATDALGAPSVVSYSKNTESMETTTNMEPKGGSTPVQPAFTREYFPDTAYFNPNIITDQNGVAEVLVPMPDSLTTWRATARSVTEDTKVGENTKEVIVTKDLLARLITTRFYTERDEAVITGIFHNYLNEEKEVMAKLEIEGGIEITDSPAYKVTVPPDGSVPIDWKVKVKRAGDCKIKLTALTDEESDALELTVPVLPHGTEKYVAFSGNTKKGAEEEITLPQEAEKGSAKLLIILEPSLASTVLTSLEYLAGYPYGCVEQTMSRFLPTVIVAKTMGELDMHDEKMSEELPKMVKQGFERLYNFHHSDGGWGWWENDESQPYMTAYVVYGLSLSREAGYEPDEHKIRAGVEWLRQNYSKTEDINTRTYMAFAVTTAGENCKDWLKDLYEKRDKLDPYSQAVLALSLEKSGLKKEAEVTVGLLEQTAEETGTMVSWTGKAHEHGWMDNQVETTAYCLRALLSVKPDSELVAKAVRFLTLNRNGNYWYSTKDTAAAVMSITSYLKITQETNPDFTADVTLNGTKIKSVKFTKDDVGLPGKKIEVPYGQGLMDGTNKVKLEMDGRGMLYYSVYLKYFTEEENIKAADSGFKVKRTYYLLKPGEQDAEKAKIKLGDSGEIKVKSQDIILVELTITGAQNYEYLIIEDPKPAGCEYDTEQRGNYSEWNYWYCHEERRDEKIAYFSTFYWPGTNTMTYRLRAETPGTFHVMPAKASLMYIDEVGGNSDEIILTVEEGEKKEITCQPVPIDPNSFHLQGQKTPEVKEPEKGPDTEVKPESTGTNLSRNIFGIVVMVLLIAVFGAFLFLKPAKK